MSFSENGITSRKAIQRIELRNYVTKLPHRRGLIKILIWLKPLAGCVNKLWVSLTRGSSVILCNSVCSHKRSFPTALNFETSLNKYRDVLISRASPNPFGGKLNALSRVLRSATKTRQTRRTQLAFAQDLSHFSA